MFGRMRPTSWTTTVTSIAAPFLFLSLLGSCRSIANDQHVAVYPLGAPAQHPAEDHGATSTGDADAPTTSFHLPLFDDYADLWADRSSASSCWKNGKRDVFRNYDACCVDDETSPILVKVQNRWPEALIPTMLMHYRNDASTGFFPVLEYAHVPKQDLAILRRTSSTTSSDQHASRSSTTPAARSASSTTSSAPSTPPSGPYLDEFIDGRRRTSSEKMDETSSSPSFSDHDLEAPESSYLPKPLLLQVSRGKPWQEYAFPMRRKKGKCAVEHAWSKGDFLQEDLSVEQLLFRVAETHAADAKVQQMVQEILKAPAQRIRLCDGRSTSDVAGSGVVNVDQAVTREVRTRGELVRELLHGRHYRLETDSQFFRKCCVPDIVRRIKLAKHLFAGMGAFLPKNITTLCPRPGIGAFGGQAADPAKLVCVSDFLHLDHGRKEVDPKIEHAGDDSYTGAGGGAAGALLPVKHILISIGSNEDWTFEEAIHDWLEKNVYKNSSSRANRNKSGSSHQRTEFVVHTYDCTTEAAGAMQANETTEIDAVVLRDEDHDTPGERTGSSKVQTFRPGFIRFHPLCIVGEKEYDRYNNPSPHPGVIPLFDQVDHGEEEVLPTRREVQQGTNKLTTWRRLLGELFESEQCGAAYACRVPLAKIDVDGWEWAIFREVFGFNHALQPKQIALEMHLWVPIQAGLKNWFFGHESEDHFFDERQIRYRGGPARADHAMAPEVGPLSEDPTSSARPTTSSSLIYKVPGNETTHLQEFFTHAARGGYALLGKLPNPYNPGATEILLKKF